MKIATFMPYPVGCVVGIMRSTAGGCHCVDYLRALSGNAVLRNVTANTVQRDTAASITSSINEAKS